MSNPPEGIPVIVWVIITAVMTLLASSGFWAWMMHKSDKKSATARLLVGIAHDRITWLGDKFIQRGYITPDEYENIYGMFKPYQELGGNGSAKRVMEKVEKLPTHGPDEQ